ncbi:MAG: DUF3192 domain-containing protein [Planctomycetes bacterium]|nr:DUF3192 domain-containing protein [Planctomycetota bacterium]
MNRLLPTLGLLALAAGILPGCVLSIGGTYRGPFDSDSNAQAVRREARNRLGELALGMTRADVDTVMGTEPVYLSREIGWVDRPFRTSRYTDTAGREITVLAYYTDLRRADDRITDDELTPVALADGRVIGWGRDFALPPPRAD